MKRSSFYCLILSAAILASCTHHNETAAGCISRYFPTTGPLVTAGQLDTLNGFFHKNNLSTNNLQFQYVNFINAPFSTNTYKGAYYQAAVGLILNGLRVPSATMYFNFDSTGNFLDSVGGYFGQLPSNDTTSQETLTSLRQIFLNNYKQCVAGGGCFNCQLVHPTAPYQDTCLAAELVYVDASIQNNNTSFGKQLIKGWLVSAADSHGFPEVTVIDNTAQAIPAAIFYP